MYITENYWEHSFGSTDDSMTLIAYLARKEREEITLGEIISDFGLEKLGGDFRKPEVPLVYVDDEGWEMEMLYAIDLLTDLAVLLLECKVNGVIDLYELDMAEVSGPGRIRITATRQEHELINEVLSDFAADPLAYDLSEMVPEEEMLEIAADCGKLRAELYGADLENA